VKRSRGKVADIEEMLVTSERKIDILTYLLKEASAEFDRSLEKVTISEANFRAIFENAPEAIVVVDEITRRILDCNPFLIDWLGYTRDELLSMRYDEILKLDAGGTGYNVQRILRYRMMRAQDRCLVKKDGTVVDAEVTGTTMEYRGKSCLVMLARDVTERRQLEEFSRYKELFESVSDPVFILDFNGRFLEVNDIAVKHLGYPREIILTMRVASVTWDSQREKLLLSRQKMKPGEIIQFELEMTNRQGDLIPFEFHARPIIYKGQPAVLSVGRDLSMRRELEQALVMTERLSAVGEMASGVAHNFNNLLQMILGAADAAAAQLASGKTKEAALAIAKIQESSQLAAGVVRRIKDFTLSRENDSGKIQTSIDLGELLREAVQLTEPLWKDLPDSRAYIINLLHADRCFALGKPSEIYEVIVNLIRNGLEAMPQGGSLTISVEAVGSKIYLNLSDTGHGIPHENLQRIFEPFFTTKGSKASGLGLSSSYGIIKRHQGEIRVESQVGRGTTFTVILPRAEKPPVKEITAAERSESNKISFLLVDDEVNILKAMEMFFEDSEVALVTCRTAREGLEAFEHCHFDVILCDLGMDDMNGWEFGKLIKTYCRNNGLTRPPFLLYTGWDRQFDSAKLEESGVDRVVIKPVPCNKLLHILQEVTSAGRLAKSATSDHPKE
jgi:PAS domain S-box-containing protein